jgi:hypothetical protein
MLLGVDGGLGLEVVGVPACQVGREGFFCCFGAGLSAIVHLVHASVVDVIAVFYGQPRVLLDLLAVLPRLQVYYVELGGLLVVNASLVSHQTPLAVAGQLGRRLAMTLRIPLHLLVPLGIKILLGSIDLVGS